MMAVRSIDAALAARCLPMQQPAPRPRLLPKVVEATTRFYAARREPLSVTPVEADGTQPGLRVPFFAPVPPGPFNLPEAVASIRKARGVGPEKPCLWPNDLGCETQLYLALALLRLDPDMKPLALAEHCHVPVPDAHFFAATLVPLARAAHWPQRKIVLAACDALQRPVECAS